MKKILVALILVAGLGFSAKAQQIPPATCKVTVTDNAKNQNKLIVLVRMQDDGVTETSEDLFLNTYDGESSLQSVYGNGTYESFYVPEGIYYIGISSGSDEAMQLYISNLGYYRVEAWGGSAFSRNYRIDRVNGDVEIVID